MGVQCRIVLYADDRAAGDDAARAAFAELNRLDRIFSDYLLSSEVSALGQAAGVHPIAVSHELLEVLEDARRVHEATGGAFDVTIGPVTLLWRESRRTGVPPDPFALADALALVDARAVRIDREASTVLLERPGMSLDLGGIAKGYSARRAVDLLRARGVPRALVALAGDIAVGDPPPGTPGWRIATPDPARTLTLSNTCISTAGPDEQSMVVDGRRRSHIIDPRTGMGAASMLSVTVASPRGSIADALSSALTLLDEAACRIALAAFPDAVAFFHGSAEPLAASEAAIRPAADALIPNRTPGNP